MFTRGVGISGSLKIIPDAGLKDTKSMVVDVSLPAMASNPFSSLKVCTLERKAGEKGVGIFVRLPSASNDLLRRHSLTYEGST